MVEQPAVNRLVVGSSPTHGAEESVAKLSYRPVKQRTPRDKHRGVLAFGRGMARVYERWRLERGGGENGASARDWLGGPTFGEKLSDSLIPVWCQLTTAYVIG